MTAMQKYLFILFVSIFSANTLLAESLLFPALYNVKDVALNDVLNVRQGAGASHPVIETLDPNQRDIEIIRLSMDGKWGLIGYPAGSGWASMRYLSRQPGQEGTDLPRPMSCGGNEPFWGLEFSLRGNDFNEPGELPHILPTVWEGIPDGMPPISYGVKMARDNAEINAIITRSQCSDGMSEKEYGFEINAILSGALGNRMLTGCCSLGQP